MDPITLNTGSTFNQPSYEAEAPIGHPSTEGRTVRQLSEERDAHRNHHPVNTFAPPSSNFDQPREPIDTAPQQASTQPGDGTEVHHTATGTTTVPFKERVVGVAQKTRGTLLGKPELKEHGQAILDGRTTHEKDRNL
ncbi:hypothetical protein EST38_g2970 [Candolleomyces aberdarensis]|uniref:Uncharacterized protein n=1 Tax=Candolleomyces aberdarensis TaxID=2316362 RepID=A0A4Q2DS64_9AGAR|nr:hypothetical protein EST38_g2970 [Candolleomyces aberdarensis]